MSDTDVVAEADTGNGAKPPKAASKKTAPQVARKRTAKRNRKNARKAAIAAAKRPHVQISADQLPRKSLEQALRVARALRDVHAGGPARWEQIATAMGIGAVSQTNKYYLWSAVGYGLVDRDGDNYTLSEVGRKILAPTRPGEDKEAMVRALLTPVIFSRFFTEYNGNPFPGEEYIGNVLEERYGVPRERVEEAKTLLRENGLYAGVLRQELDGTMVVRLDPSTTGIPTPPADHGEKAAEGVQQPPSGGTSLDFSTMCLVVTPIGDDDSEERKHANLILKSVIEPVVGELKLVARRADQIDRAGIITQQIFECLARARICIADLSFNNPNAFYELGVPYLPGVIVTIPK